METKSTSKKYRINIQQNNPILNYPLPDKQIQLSPINRDLDPKDHASHNFPPLKAMNGERLDLIRERLARLLPSLSLGRGSSPGVTSKRKGRVKHGERGW